MPFLGGGSAIAAVLTAPGAFNGSASGNTISASWLAAPIPALVKGVRIWGQRVSEASDAYEPATWTMLSYLNTGTSWVDRSYIWDRDPVNLRIAYVGVDNSVGPYSFVSNLSVIWGPLNQLSLMNQDLSNAVWVKNAGVTIGGTAGNQTVTFSGANLACNQTIPALLNGATYTFYYRVQGTNGQTINFSVYDQDASTGTDYFHTFDGTVQDLVFTRTIATTGRRLSIGPNTYAGTARSLTVLKTAVSSGTFTQAQMIANWELTQGPGSTRQEPAKPTGPVTYDGHWIHSENPNIPAIDIADGTVTVQNARLSSRGHIIRANNGNPSLNFLNSRTWAMHPMTNGTPKGYAVTMAYGTNLIVENNSFRSGRGVFYQYGRAATAVRVRYNIHRDIDPRYGTSTGGYVRSSYSTIQNRPPGAPIGRTIGNLFQGQGSFDSANPPQGIDIDRNEVTIRVGYGAGEDTASFIQCRGSATTPYFCRNNMFFNSAMPWDYIWHDTSNPANQYNYNNILTTFNLTLTVGAAGAASGATSIPLASSLYLNAYSIPSGTVLTFTGGKTATVSGTQGGNLTSLTVTALGTALASGDVATISNVQDGPGTYSGTAIMLGDGILTPTNVNGSYEKQSRWGRAENNITIGPSAIQSICQGGDMEIRNSLLVNTKRTYDGTVTDSGNRDAFWQLLSFGSNTATALDAGGVARTIWQNNGINNGKGYFVSGAGILIGSGDGNTSLVYGNRPVVGIRSYLDAVMIAADWRTEATQLGLTIGPTS